MSNFISLFCRVCRTARHLSVKVNTSSPTEPPKILGAKCISDSKTPRTMFKSIQKRSKKNRLPDSITGLFDFRTIDGMIFADKTMFIERLEKAGRFNYIFLRPRRFGKSAFLNMLCTYYDIRTAPFFKEMFGPLHVGKNPTEWCTKHLILQFDLSSIGASGSLEDLEMRFRYNINQVLKRFLKKYKEELGNPIIGEVINLDTATQSLINVLDLVREANHTLFVGVDEFDAPANSIVFNGRNLTLGDTRLEKLMDVENFFKDNFFSVLKQGYGGRGMTSAVISKYFLTGIIPAFRSGMSPLLASQLVSHKPELHGICGFTEDDVRTHVRHYLCKKDEELDQIVDYMRTWYNGYSFTNSELPTLYNPQLVFHFLSNFGGNGFDESLDDCTSFHSSHILRQIADSGDFSVNDLIKLISDGSVKTKVMDDFGSSDPLKFGKERDISWSFLQYMGILTREPKNCGLKIPNKVIRDEVLGRILKYLEGKEEIRALIGPAFNNLIQGYTGDFVQLLKTFMNTRSLRTLISERENVLQCIVEMVLDKPSYRAPELSLVMDCRKKGNERGRYGFVDVFIAPFELNGKRTLGVALELKYIALDGLWRGERGREYWDKIPTPKESTEFENELKKDNEERLLVRKYVYWYRPNNAKEYVPASTTVKDIVDGALNQVQGYVDTIAKGRAEKNKSGIRTTIKVDDEDGCDTLQGHAIIGVSGRHIIVRSTEQKLTKNKY